MKLKTLKDLGQSKRDCCSVEKDYNNICEKCIKQEAIKQIIYGLKYRRNFFKVFMEFHNITEEDLK